MLAESRRPTAARSDGVLRTARSAVRRLVRGADAQNHALLAARGGCAEVAPEAWPALFDDVRRSGVGQRRTCFADKVPRRERPGVRGRLPATPARGPGLAAELAQITQQVEAEVPTSLTARSSHWLPPLQQPRAPELHPAARARAPSLRAEGGLPPAPLLPGQPLPPTSPPTGSPAMMMALICSVAVPFARPCGAPDVPRAVAPHPAPSARRWSPTAARVRPRAVRQRHRRLLLPPLDEPVSTRAASSRALLARAHRRRRGGRRRLRGVPHRPLRPQAVQGRPPRADHGQGRRRLAHRRRRVPRRRRQARQPRAGARPAVAAQVRRRRARLSEPQPPYSESLRASWLCVWRVDK